MLILITTSACYQYEKKKQSNAGCSFIDRNYKRSNGKSGRYREACVKLPIVLVRKGSLRLFEKCRVIPGPGFCLSLYDLNKSTPT